MYNATCKVLTYCEIAIINYEVDKPVISKICHDDIVIY